MIGTLSQLMSAVNSKQAEIGKKISVINEFCKQTKLNPVLRQKIHKAICYNSENEGFLALNKNEIFEEIRPDLKWQVLVPCSPLYRSSWKCTAEWSLTSRFSTIVLNHLWHSLSRIYSPSWPQKTLSFIIGAIFRMKVSYG